MDNYANWKNWRKAIAKAGFLAQFVQGYEQSIEKYRNNADAHTEWGHLFYNRGSYTEALEKYQKALEKDTKNSPAHRYLISCFANLNDFANVKEEARRLLSYEPDNSDAYYQLVFIARSDRDFDEATKQTQEGERKGISWWIFYTQWAWILKDQGKYKEALQKFDELLQSDLENDEKAEIYYDYGNLLLELNRYEEAKSQFQKAIQLKPDNAFAYHNLASVFFTQGQYEEAWSKWKKTVEIYSTLKPALNRVVDDGEFVNSSEFYYHALILQSIEHDIKTAQNILEQGLAFNPRDILILSGLTSLMWEMKGENFAAEIDVSRKRSDYHWQAMDYFQQAQRLLTQRLERHETYYNLIELGNLYLTVEDYQKATECYEKAQLKNETVSLPLAQLGVIQIRLKKYEKAISLFEQSLRINPDDLDVKSSLAEACLRLDNLDEAEKYYREVLTVALTHVQSLIGIGETCLAWGEKKETERYSEAIDFFSKALDVAKNKKIRSKYLTTQETAKVYYLRGYTKSQLYENSKMHRNDSILKDALTDFRQSRDLNPDNQKTIRAINTLEKRLQPFSPARITETLGPISIFGFSVFIFLAAQVAFLILPHFNKPSESNIPTPSVSSTPTASVSSTASPSSNVGSEKSETSKSSTLESPIKSGKKLFELDSGSYAILTFGSLLFMVVGLYLPQVLKLSVAGISLEKSTLDQAQAGGTLGINKLK